MVAAYRIAVQHESADQAIAEMYRFHYARFWLPQLQRYVSAFPNDLKKNMLFASYSPEAPAGASTLATILPAR
jgi:hypothetical protein